MIHAQWLAHGGGDAGPVLIMLVPVSLLYGIGLILCFRPILKAMTTSPDEPTEAEKLAAEMLGEGTAKEQAAKARRLRSMNRREVRETISSGSRSDDGG
jgi:hypothetical protein